MYFDDLSPYTYTLPPRHHQLASAEPPERALNVGWLEDGYYFKAGRTPWLFRWKLRRLVRFPKNDLMWGVHVCDLCERRDGADFGNGELHVRADNGTTYIAPVLIVHYVSKHKYLPPNQFIDAVLASGR